jgi:hypothetical protein
MSRKNNIFPKYVKLKIDKDNPPADLWERGARRCLKCRAQWPAYSIFNPSPCCNASTEVLPNESSHLTWSESVEKLLEVRFERYYDKWNDNVTDEELIWDRSIEDDLPMDEEALKQGLEEIDRLTGEPPKLSMEK